MLAEIVVEMSKAHMFLKLATDMKRASTGTLEIEERLREMWVCCSMGQVKCGTKNSEVHYHRICKNV